jgi:hypothetical protein
MIPVITDEEREELLTVLTANLLTAQQYAEKGRSSMPITIDDVSVLLYGTSRYLMGESKDVQWGIRWDNGIEVDWPSRRAAEIEIASVAPNEKGQLIQRDVTYSSWRCNF